MTERSSHRISKEPKGALYRALIDCGLNWCDTFLVVVRPSQPIQSSAKEVLDELHPYIQQTTTGTEWPGTKLFRGTATLYRYRLCLPSATILKGAAGRLYEWQQPMLPEDLSLLRGDGEPWLVTISHEAESYLSLSCEERAQILKLLPGLL